MKCPYCGEEIPEDLIRERDPNYYDTFDNFRVACPYCNKVIEIWPESIRSYDLKKYREEN